MAVLFFLAGMLLAALAGAAAFPEVGGLTLAGEKLALLLASHFLLGLLTGLVLFLALRPWRQRLSLGAWLLGGLAFGLVPLAGHHLAPGAGLIVRAGLALAGLAGGLLLGAAWHPPRWLGPLAAGLGLGALVAIVPAVRAAPLGAQPGPALAAAEPGAAPEGPDVLLVSVDTLRADALFRPDTPTPVLDALRVGAPGAVEAQAPSGETRPSHATMLSGLPIERHGVWTNRSLVPAELPRLAEAFAAAGWRTAAVVSNGVISAASGLDRGFATYDDSAVRYGGLLAIFRRNAASATWAGWLLPARALDSLVTTELLGLPQAEGGASALGARTTGAALAYLDGLLAAPRPWFFFVHFMDPHKPYWPDASVRGSLADPGQLPARYRKKQPWKQDIARLQRDLLAEPGNPELQQAAALLHRVYDEETVFIDRCLGRLLERIRAGGRPTVILFTADHGEGFGEHGLFLHGNSVYGELLRVPFLLATPGAPPPLPAQPRLADVPALLLRAAGLDPGAFAGPPVRPPLLAGRPLGPEEDRVPGWGETGWQFAVVDQGWKLLFHADKVGEPGARLEARALFELRGDVAEQRDQLAEQPARAEALLNAARPLVETARTGAAEELSPEQRALLEELGYIK